MIIAIAIPMAMVFTFSFMYLYRTIFRADVTINIISLSGLMMAVGMLVDNSVVVLENIFRLRQEKKLSPLHASMQGASEVALAVTASTLTTLVVFISLGFMSQSGFGRFMRDFALTISLALIASLLVSLYFHPPGRQPPAQGKAKEKARWLVKLTSWLRADHQLHHQELEDQAECRCTGHCHRIGLISFMLSNIEQEFMPSSDEREIDLICLHAPTASRWMR